MNSVQLCIWCVLRAHAQLCLTSMAETYRISNHILNFSPVHPAVSKMQESTLNKRCGRSDRAGSAPTAVIGTTRQTYSGEIITYSAAVHVLK